jgi:hypothetical protein
MTKDTATRDTGIGSYSYANRADLPGGEPGFYASAPKTREAFDNARDPLIAAQNRDAGKSEAQRRFELSRRESLGSSMVERDQPKPVLKPSPALSMGPDRAAFNRAWSDEHRSARKKDKDKGADPLPEISAYTPLLQQVRVTFAFREIETRETFIEKRRAEGKASRKRETQSRS